MIDEQAATAASGGAMEPAELLALLRDELADAEQYTDVLIGSDRAKALDYYLRRPMGDERKGRSQVISGEVYKVVEGVSTAIADIFAGAKDAIEFVPRRPEDVKGAEQRTAAVGYVFFTQNNGFLSMIESIKDGIMSKSGFLTWRWEATRRVTEETYRDQTPQSLALLTQDNEDVQIIEQSESRPALDPATGQQLPDPLTGEPVMLFDVKARVVSKKGRAVVEAVPPEEILVSSRARSSDVQKAPAITWRSYKTRSELLKCGYDEEAIDLLSFSASRTMAGTSVRRTVDDADAIATGEALIYTTWLEVDADGDGIVELRRVVWSDGLDEPLENEITDEINLSHWSPIIQPHEFFGRCPADDATEGQEVMTVLKRQTLDNLYLANNPMWRVDDRATGVRIEDFYSPEIGRPMRAPKDAAEAVIFPFVAQHTFPMLEYEQSDTENKTGWTRYAQGLDAKSLNQTARGISMITSMSQQRTRLMARIYGELCLKPAMRGLAKLLSQHGEEALVFRLNGSYVTVDPREWKEEFDMTVTVGLGTTDRDQQLMHLTSIAAAQAQAVSSGMLGKLVTPKNLYNVQAKIAENAGFRDPSFAWTDPDTVEPAAPQPSPEEVKQQAETQRKQIEIESNMQLEQWKFAQQQQFEAWKVQQQMELERFKAELRAQSELEIGTMRAQAQAFAAANRPQPQGGMPQ